MLRPYLPGGSFVKRARILVALTLVGCTRSSSSLTDALSRATWVDLTYAFDSTTIYWPTAKPFRLEVVSAQRTSGGYYYAANNFAAAEHGGTHLDAPVHFAEGRHTTDQIPLTQLTGPTRIRDRDAADVEVAVEVAVLDPARTVEPVRHVDQLPTELGDDR